MVILAGVFAFIILTGYFVLFFLLAARKKKKLQGVLGEKTVAAVLKQCALEGDKIISNLIIAHPQTGMTPEIDHILLSTRGCFIIEVKDFSGEIYGGESERTWRQVLGRNETVVNTFYSPLKQNEAHIFHLKQILHTSVYMENIVIFVQGNTENIPYKNIFSLQQFADHLNRIETKVLSEKERDELFDALTELQKQAPTKERHIQNIQKQQWKIENNICPRCGKKLILRNGPYGEFYGCTGYPDCKFKKNK